MSEPAPLVRPDRLAALLQRLVDIYSPSGKEETIVDAVDRALRKAGLPVRRQPVSEGRDNLIVAPEGLEPRLLLVGHLDTVPAHDLEDYRYRPNGDRIHGLGTADMKGGCAAMIEAFLALHEGAAAPAAAALCLVVGEEEEGDGTAALVEELHAPWAVIGEPTDLVPCLAHHGYVEIGLTTSGSRRHASLADGAGGAVQGMLRLLLGLSEHIARERPEATLNIRDLSSAASGFAVPERCDAQLDLHAPPTAPIVEMAAELEDLAEVAGRQLEGVDVSFTLETIDRGYELPERGALVEALRLVFERRGLPFRPASFRSHSDASQLWSAGIRPVVLGPGRLEDAHAPGESVSFAQVLAAAELYAELVQRLEARP